MNEVDAFFHEADQEVSKTAGRAITISLFPGREFYVLWGEPSASGSLRLEGYHEHVEATAQLAASLVSKEADREQLLSEAFTVKTLDTQETYTCRRVTPEQHAYVMYLDQYDPDEATC